MKDIIVAIDGYSSCGKSSLARDIARVLGYGYIDTGAMYRAVTWHALQTGLIEGNRVNEEHLAQALDTLRIHFVCNPTTLCNETFLNGQNIEDAIRMPEVAEHVSPVSALPFVRHAMVAMQQEMGKEKRVVMDGRDIGTVVFPQAEVKIFMTAQPEIRARRRLAELTEKGVNTSFDEVLANLKMRDHLDETRETAPLRKAPDALIIDNSNLSRQGQLEIALKHIDSIMHES